MALLKSHTILVINYLSTLTSQRYTEISSRIGFWPRESCRKSIIEGGGCIASILPPPPLIDFRQL
jgi:hypothetical protein